MQICRPLGNCTTFSLEDKNYFHWATSTPFTCIVAMFDSDLAVCSKSWLEGGSRTTSSAKRRDEIHWSPNQTPSGPWLRLEILSIKVMNRTGDKGQLCQNPTCTRNRSDFVPAMRTKLLLRSYRDRKSSLLFMNHTAL
ncbi:hypothetical protein AMECASPLE_014480 [Ameca splendens]|uniref:Uncharacterized protein n=1 Tax=Ameca splendens TaxID=208324 RepID=A0ABV0Y1I4_9TELE